jgi:hypothetical protein
MNRIRRKRRRNYAHNGENEESGHEADGNEESVDKENTEQ